jgi:solute carrier family 25 protein 33/36
MRERDPLLRAKYSSLWKTFAVIVSEEGFRGLYGGLGAHLIRVIPNAAIMFYTYETVVWALSRDRKQT